MKYIGYYDKQDSTLQRDYVTAGSNKLEYIAKAISEFCDVEIISVSAINEKKFHFYRGEIKTISSKVKLKLFFSWGGNFSLVRKLRLLWHPLILFLYLLFNAHKNETIVVYHSLGYYNSILWAKKIKKFKLILEVEEIYTDVLRMKPYFKNLEYEMFSIADAFIFSTELLNDKLNRENKPYTVIYGTYQVEPQVVGKFDNEKIHVVYAGTFDPRKGGSAAAAAAEFLPANYHVHICGFGSEKDTNYIKSVINKTSKRSRATISFEGLLKGRDYVEFLQRCHIGLSTQDPNAAFNATSFPSKILSYMANGLSVVSIRIKAIEESSVGKYLSYYDKQTPESIASAIMNTNIKVDNRHIISDLNKHFIVAVNKLINNVSR
jgi:glycosyltransferase involved in cell wall biosynthesis